MSQYKQWDIQLFNKRTNQYINDSSGQYFVMTNGAPTLITLKADQQGTALSQPATLSSGRLTFYTAKTVTSLDVTVQLLDSNGLPGRSVFAQGISSSVHRLDVYPEDGNSQVLVIPMYSDIGGTTVQNSGFDLLGNMVVRDISVKITSLGADANTTDATLDVGLSGSTDLLLAAMPEIATGFTVPIGANTDSVEFVFFGTGLAQIELGTSTADNGTLIRKMYNQATTTDIVFQHNVTTGSSVLGYILIDYTVIPG